MFWRNSPAKLSFLHHVRSKNEFHLCIVNNIQTKVKPGYEKFTQNK